MKPVTMFRDILGNLHKTAREALKAEKRFAEVKNARNILGGEIRDENCKFSNGGGYYQLSESNVKLFDSTFISLVKRYERALYDRMKKTDQGDLTEKIPTSGFVGRWLDDSDSDLYILWSLRSSIDSQNRRWGQPYFAYNPAKAEQKCLGSL